MEASLEEKGACECWEFFKNALLEAKKQLIPSKDKRSRQSKRFSWLNYKLLNLIRTKRDRYEKCQNRWKTTEKYKRISKVWRDAVTKAKAWLKLILTRDVKNYKKLFNDKRKQKENTVFLLNRRGKSVSKNAEKGEVLNISFTSICNSIGTRPWEQKSRLK